MALIVEEKHEKPGLLTRCKDYERGERYWVNMGGQGLARISLIESANWEILEIRSLEARAQ